MNEPKGVMDLVGRVEAVEADNRKLRRLSLALIGITAAAFALMHPDVS